MRSRRSSTTPACCGCAAAGRHRRLVVARPVRRSAALLPARRRRLGRHALARHGDVPRALVHRRARAGRRLAERTRAADPAELVARRCHAFCGRLPTTHAADRRRLLTRVREGAARGAHGRPAPYVETALLRRPRRLLDRHLHERHDGCHDCNRTELLRRAVAEAGRGLPEIEPGMPLPAGTGPHAAAVRLARRRARARGLRRQGALELYALDDGIAACGGERARDAEGGRHVFLNGGIDALSVLFPAGDPAYYTLRPTLALAQTAAAARSPRTAASAGTRRRTGSRRCTPRARSRCCRRSATTTRTSRTSPRGTTTRSARPTRRCRTGWLGRYLDAVGARDNPLQGLTLDVALHPVDRDREGARRDARGRRPVPVRAARVERASSSRPRSSRRRRTSARRTRSRRTRACARPGRRRTTRITSTTSSARSSYGFQSPVAYPTSTDPFPHRLAGLAAMIADGMPLRVVGLDHGPLRHARDAGGRR